jgi:hypothetical protein
MLKEFLNLEQENHSVFDYMRQFNYHPGKANVIVDALSRKAHYNCLLAICLTGEESST